MVRASDQVRKPVVGSKGAGQVLGSTDTDWESRLGWSGGQRWWPSQPVNIGAKKDLWRASLGQVSKRAWPVQHWAPEARVP